MKLEELKTFKKIYLLGYGAEGKSTHEFLKKFHPDAEIGIGDKSIDADYVEKQKDYELIIKSPGVPIKLVKGKHTTATNIFLANTKALTIGITGTKGKSTTANLLYQAIQAAKRDVFFVGNIGKPMLDLLVQEIDAEAVVILELSSYQLEDIQFSPHISCVLNVYEELHNHESFEAYRAAKYNIARYAGAKDYLVYNPHLPELEELLRHTQAKLIPLAENISSFSYPETLNEDTIRAVISISSLLSLSHEIVQDTILSYKNLPHRIETIGTYRGITFINDSAANHPQATLHALESIKNVKTILLGGQNRGFDFKELVVKLKKKGVENIALFPDTEKDIEALLLSMGDYHPNIIQTSSMEEAVSFAFAHTPQNSVCLLSPGAPSYTMFTNFPERAEAFINAIHSYEEENS